LCVCSVGGGARGGWEGTKEEEDEKWKKKREAPAHVGVSVCTVRVCVCLSHTHADIHTLCTLSSGRVYT
jgi:hypothetical protein